MPRQVDHDRRRADIARAAWELMAERGPAGTTLREVGAALGMANGAVRHYFPGKDAVVEAAYRHGVDAAEARIERAVRGASGLAALRALAVAVLGAPGADVPGVPPVAVEAAVRRRDRIAALLDRARADGEVRTPWPTPVLVEQLLALLAGTRAVAPAPGQGPDLRGQVIEAFLSGLGRDGGAPDRPPAPEPGRDGAGEPDGPPPDPPSGFLAFAGTALDRTAERMPETDRASMTLVLLLHRVASSLVYDLESTVHRPAGWSWSAFRMLFTVWIAGEQEAGRVAGLCGMSRAAVSSLANTLAAAGLVERRPAPRDRRMVHLSLTTEGRRRLEEAFRRHNRRESEWAALLPDGDLEVLNDLLGRLARAAQQADWVKRRS
ncbi:TetR family transcriptional regulator [Pseudonocardia spirodelae]|uniref:TetR family transcriptional regulator n=1 Tax=Pseudonocardia spirodelae TaxID=3133431 RepID=A0ABU8T2F8_9PSEU